MFWRFFHKMMDLSPILVAVFMGKTRWYTIEPGLQKPYCSGDINGLPHLTLKNTLKLYNWFRIPTSKTTHISDVMIWNSSATISVSSKGILLGSMRPRARKKTADITGYLPIYIYTFVALIRLFLVISITCCLNPCAELLLNLKTVFTWDHETLVMTVKY